MEETRILVDGFIDTREGHIIPRDSAPLVRISYQAALTMKAWVRMAPGEISWFGTLFEKKSGDRTILYVDEVLLPEQECSGAHSTVPASAMFKLMDRIDETNGRIKDRDIRFWGHSHATFKPFLSGIDRATQMQLSGTGNWLSLVTNHASVAPHQDGQRWVDNFASDSLASYGIADPMPMPIDWLQIEEIQPGVMLLENAVDEFAGKILNLPEGYEPKVDNGHLIAPIWIPEDTEPEAREVLEKRKEAALRG